MYPPGVNENGSSILPEPQSNQVPDEYTRPINHLINEAADTDLFNTSFHGAPNADSVDNVANFPPPESYDNIKTGISYYEGCVDHYCLWDDNYEENPKRFTRTLERMKEYGLVEKCHYVQPRKANEKELLLVHTPEYVETIANTKSVKNSDELEKISSKYDAVYINSETYDISLYSAGSVIDMADKIVTGELRNGFVLSRPPGHHAMASEACGYCVFNNVAIAASYCLTKYHLKRILIVDWDVHHGQATQQAFYNDDRVLYVSLHRYEMGAFWPELIESNYNFVGEDKGRGFNVNVPLNETRLCDSDYLSIWHNVLLPIFYQFNPELVIVSAGYDAAIGCPEGEMLLTPPFYAHVTHSLMGLANGKVCVALEGGYCVESLADSAALTLRTLLGDPPIPLKMRYPIKESVVESALDVISVQRSHWNFLRMQRTFNRHDGNIEETRHKRHYPLIEYRGELEFLPEKPQSYPTRDCYPIQSDEVKESYLKAIKILRQHTELTYTSYSNKRTCLVMMNDIARRHAPCLTHPERPNRVIFLWKFLKSKNIIEKCHVIKDNNRFATEDQIRLCHSEEAIEKVRQSQSKHYKDLREYECQFDSLYFTQDTYQVAQLSTGSLLQVVDSVMRGECLNGFACVRPPGHHAGRDNPAGFCFFNNISIAARYAIKEYKLSRVLILDWDIHHGDGTQDICINDEQIVFISLHRFDHAAYYPEKLESNYPIAKNIINIPWNGGPMGDKEYLAAFFNVVLPIAYNFNPELVLISAGFDSAKGDPLGEYNLSPQVYGHMTHMLSSLANGKIILTLEGGYHLKTIADCAYECISVLMGNPPKVLELDKDDCLNECAIETIENVIDYHATNWPCLAFNVDIPESKL